MHAVAEMAARGRGSGKGPRIRVDQRDSKWTAVFIVAFSFARLHIDAYTTSAITAIAGLHMFPLARLFRYPLHYLTGGLLVVWAATSAALVPVAADARYDRVGDGDTAVAERGGDAGDCVGGGAQIAGGGLLASCFVVGPARLTRGLSEVLKSFRKKGDCDEKCSKKHPSGAKAHSF